MTTIDTKIDAAAPVAVSEPPAPPGPLREFWQRFSANGGAVVGMWVIVGITVLAILADVVAPHPPTQQFPQFLQHQRRAPNTARHFLEYQRCWREEMEIQPNQSEAVPCY